MTLLRRIGNALVLFLVLSGNAWAGPHAGGILVAHSPGLFASATDGSVDLCAQGAPLTSYGSIYPRIDGATISNPAIWKVYCVFPSADSPRLSGLTFGLAYDVNKITLLQWGNCANFELRDWDWPLSGTGNSLLWNNVVTERIIQAYWFFGYAYSPATVDLGPHPDQGGTFADDTSPPLFDAIAGYGRMGFNMDGTVPPLSGGAGACCDRETGTCSMLTAEECGPNIFKGSSVTCDSSPCTSIGACCDPINVWCTEMTMTACDAVTGAFLGVESTCTVEGSVLCFVGGACCQPCGCSITLENACSPPGVWHGGGTDCSPDPCTPMTAVCCDQMTGACALTPESACTGAHFWRCQWLSCAPDPCPQPGACCNSATGGCALLLQDGCAAPQIWHPEWTSCAPNPCPQVGACCDLNGSCLLLLEVGCVTPSAWYSEWLACSPNPCPPSAVRPDSSPRETVFLAATPNPFSSSTTIWYRQQDKGRTIVEILDAAGRMVRRTFDTAARGSVVWNGKDDAGRDLPAGIYLIRVKTPEGTNTGRAVLIR